MLPIVTPFFDGMVVDHPIMHSTHDLAKEQRRNFADDITSAIRIAKKKRWGVLEDQRRELQTGVKTLLLQLLEERNERLVAQANVQGGNRKQIGEINTKSDLQVAEVKDVFSKAEGDIVREVPDYICGKISFDIMTDPVVSPSGITYNRSDIEDHLQRVGHFDPITRQKLTSPQLIPNLAMKEMIDAFIARNVWIEDY